VVAISQPAGQPQLGYLIPALGQRADDLDGFLRPGPGRQPAGQLPPGVRSIPRGLRTATRAAPAGLTAREQEALALLADGLADREISQRLFISERTVHHHVSAVLSKISVSSQTAAAPRPTGWASSPDCARGCDRGWAVTLGRRAAN
jgi:DNA-binding CsgD family transcriptional regulator